MDTKHATWLAVGLLTLVAGCATTTTDSRFALRYEKGWEKHDLDKIVARAGKGDVEIVTLGSTAWVSHHVAVVRGEEKPHYHRFHDLTVNVLRGEGILNIEGKRIEMKAGDVAHVQRGTPHWFRNTGSQPAAAFVVFSPPFDGRDTVSAKEESKPAEGDAKKQKSSWMPW